MTTATPTHDDEKVTADEGDTAVHAETSRLDRFGHERPRYDDINTPVLFLVGLISAILTFLTIAFVEGLTHHWQNGLIKTLNYDVTNYRQVETINKQKEILQGDTEKGILSLDSVVDDVIVKYRRHASPETGPGGDGIGDNGTGEPGHAGSASGDHASPPGDQNK